MKIAFTLKDVDLKIPAHRVQEEVRLPTGRGKPVRITMFAGGEMATKAKAAGIDATKAEATLRKLNPQFDELTKPGKTIIVPGETQVIEANIHEQVVSMRPGEIELSAPLGFASFQTSSKIRNARLRHLPTTKTNGSKYGQ